MQSILTGFLQSDASRPLAVPTGHMPQLDSLRTFAVMLVVVFHWFPTGVGINRLPNGTIGVMIFFVISGFLITRILLKNRNQIATGRATLAATYRTFLVRRVLRIFPLYYIVITFVWLALPGSSDIDEHPLYYYLYGYNILLNQTGNWADVLSPFWTLAVEEQLYLIFPWVVLLTPKRIFGWVIVGMVSVAVLFRGYGYTLNNLDGLLTPATLDAFGLGALWAYVLVDRPGAIRTVLTSLNLLAGVALLGFTALQMLPYTHVLTAIFLRLFIAVLSLYLVAHASLGIDGPMGQLLNNPGMQYIGRISYGIYVFHMLVPGYFMPTIIEPVVRRLTNSLEITVIFDFWTYRLCSLAVLLAVASLSWFLFEKPINGLKRYFSYR